MADQYNGKAANVSRLAAVNVSASTNTTPTLVTTAAPHGMTTGDYAAMGGHSVNSYNGVWQVSVQDATNVFLLATVAAGAGGATGILQPMPLSPTFATPTDGADDMTAASVNVPLDALGDRTAYLGNRLSAWRIVERVFLSASDTNEPASTGTTWAQTTYAAGDVTVATFPTPVPIIAGDVVTFRGQVSLEIPANTNTCYVKAMRDLVGGSAIDFGNHPRIEYKNNAAAVVRVSLPLFFEETIAANTVSTQYTVNLIGRNATTGGNILLLNNSTYELTLLRSNA